MQARLTPWSPVAIAAFVWGLTCFLPVGVVYLSALLLVLAILFQRNTDGLTRSSRWQQIRQHIVFWPLCVFLAWSLLILLIQPRYIETTSNLFHIFRIALTMVVVLALTRREAQAGLMGWALGAVLTLLIIYTHTIFPLPLVVGLRDMLQMSGNKSISIAVLLAIFGSCTFIYAWGSGVSNSRRAGAVVIFMVIPVLIWLLPSRTSLLVVLLSLLLGIAHSMWRKPRWLALALLSLVVLGIGISQAPQVRERFVLGLVQLQESLASEDSTNAKLHHSSWGMRYQLYTHTADMVAEKPLLGWGIGSWNDQWKKRTPQDIHASNMPHNDFLWIGAQTGVPGMLALLAIMLSLLVSVIRLNTLAATASIAASTGLLVAMSFNNALRDAQIGMSVLFVVMLVNVFALGERRDPLKPN